MDRVLLAVNGGLMSGMRSNQAMLDAARCGLPILCEKPLAMDRCEAAEMVAATDAAGVSLYTAFCYRFSPCVLKIRELS